MFDWQREKKKILEVKEVEKMLKSLMNEFKEFSNKKDFLLLFQSFLFFLFPVLYIRVFLIDPYVFLLCVQNLWLETDFFSNYPAKIESLNTKLARQPVFYDPYSTQNTLIKK